MIIWVIGRDYPTPSNRMCGSFELNQAKMLAADNKVLYIGLTLSFFRHGDPRGYRTFSEDDITILAYSHFYFPGQMGIYSEAFERRCWRNVLQQAEEITGKPDIIHIHYPTMIGDISSIEYYRKAGSRIFITEHWSKVLINKLTGHELKRLRYYADASECIISVSRIVQEAIRNTVNVSVPMKVIPNAIASVFFKKQKSNQRQVFTFIAVGRMVAIKQFDKVIEEFRKVFANTLNVRLRVIGSGPEMKKLMKIAGNDSRIEFLGSISIEKVAEEMAQANALVSFSKYETFCVPVIEAWATGIPAIVSAQSGVAEYVNDDNGIVVSSDSSDLLGEAMMKIYKENGRYNSKNISCFAKQYFDKEIILSEIKNLYKMQRTCEN